VARSGRVGESIAPLKRSRASGESAFDVRAYGFSLDQVEAKERSARWRRTVAGEHGDACYELAVRKPHLETTHVCVFLDCIAANCDTN
jgi:hypothetical protein